MDIKINCPTFVKDNISVTFFASRGIHIFNSYLHLISLMVCCTRTSLCLSTTIIQRNFIWFGKVNYQNASLIMDIQKQDNFANKKGFYYVAIRRHLKTCLLKLCKIWRNQMTQEYTISYSGVCRTSFCSEQHVAIFSSSR